MLYGYNARDVDPGDRAAAREGNNGVLVAAATLCLLLIAIITIFVITFTTSAYCPPGAPCDTAALPTLLALLA